MSHYANPLHRPVSSALHSHSCSVSFAIQGSIPTLEFHRVTRVLIPQPTFTPLSKWKSSMSQALPLARPITFGYRNHSRPGVPMSELCSRGFGNLLSLMQGVNDPVFFNTGLKKITLRILWPGYEHIEWARSIDLYPHGPITRCYLGAAIASNYARFIEKSQYESFRTPEWRLGPIGIGIEHLLLVSLSNVSGDSWQAEVAIDIRQ